jgi:phage terminase large subunit-like protein
MAGNVSIEQHAADNWKTSKKRSPERINGIVALVMALAMVHDTDDEAMPIMEIELPPWP